MIHPPRAIYFAPLAMVWYSALLTDFNFNFLRPNQIGLLFNDMLWRLLNFDCYISPEAIGFESFTRNGKTIAYFGIFPAIARLPFVGMEAFPFVHFGNISCLVALGAWVTVLLRTVDVIEQATLSQKKRPLLQWSLRICMILTGPQIYLLVCGHPYNEAAFWAVALACAFNLIVITDLVRGQCIKPRNICLLAVLAATAVHARVSIGISLSISITLIILYDSVITYRQSGFFSAIRRIALPIAVLGVSALVASMVNYCRWGNPITFADYNYYDMLQRYPKYLPSIIVHGEFNVSRIWVSLTYYGLGIGYFLQWLPGVGAWLAELYYAISAPPASEFMLIPLVLWLAVIGIRQLPALYISDRHGTVISALNIGGLAMAPLCILMYYALVMRYRVDFYPLFTFAGFLGYRAVLNDQLPTWARRTSSIAVALAVVGTMATHYALVLGKITDRGVPMEVRRAWLQLAPFAAASLSRP